MTLTGNAAPVVAGVAGISGPLWLAWLPVVWQVGVAGLGALVLCLTAWNKWLDIQQKRRDLRNEIGK